MITSAELEWMRETENSAMGSLGTIHRATFGTSVLGNQQESWSAVGTVVCDVWPVERDVEEVNTDVGDISEGLYYISVPYDTDVTFQDIIDIDNISYQVEFVPKSVTWQTNLRLHARNINQETITK